MKGIYITLTSRIVDLGEKLFESSNNIPLWRNKLNKGRKCKGEHKGAFGRPKKLKLMRR